MFREALGEMVDQLTIDHDTPENQETKDSPISSSPVPQRFQINNNKTFFNAPCLHHMIKAIFIFQNPWIETLGNYFLDATL